MHNCFTMFRKENRAKIRSKYVYSRLLRPLHTGKKVYEELKLFTHVSTLATRVVHIIILEH